jgi:hypothetical protein
VPSFPEFNETTPIHFLSRTKALTHLKLLPSKTPPTVLSDEQLASLLRKTELGPNDRANHNMICAQLQEVLDQSDRIGLEMYQGEGKPTKWMNVMGELIPPDQHDEILYKYHNFQRKEIAPCLGITGGSYVRIRPTSTNKRYEYMPNGTYKFSTVQSDFNRHKLTLANCRWYYDGPMDKTNAHCLYPYHSFCPGLGINFKEMNTRLGIDSLQYMEETKTMPPRPFANMPSNRNETKLKHHETVQLLVDIGAIEDSTGDTLDQYLKLIEFHLSEAQYAQTTTPFVTAKKFLTLQENRLRALQKAVQNVKKMPLQHGVYVNNLPEDTNNEEGNTSPIQQITTHCIRRYSIRSTSTAAAGSR